MGKEEYADRNVKKLEKYTLSDHFDETGMILTFETDKVPHNIKVVEEKIKKYLL